MFSYFYHIFNYNKKIRHLHKISKVFILFYIKVSLFNAILSNIVIPKLAN